MSHSNFAVVQFRKAIQAFLQERLQPKLDKLKEGEDEKRQQLIEAYKPDNWIPDAARRVGQIQQITHALKYIHPEAKGTNLNAPGNAQVSEFLVGTHTIASQYSPDVVGNAAALDVYKFLRLSVGGKTLLSCVGEDDAALKEAFSADDEQATQWMNAFSGLTESKGEASSHKLAKQLYWPVNDSEYHLLAPLFPTSLVHEVWSTMREDRFSEGAKKARDARKAKTNHPTGYCEYPNVVIQKFGGTKPQNISQLNSERYGENQLLPSCPPNWKSKLIKPPLRTESVFDNWFLYRPRVKGLVSDLRRYLYSLPEHRNNINIRNKRAELVAYIVDELLLFSSELRELESDWSLHEDCRLNIDEQCWLNPWRAESDVEFSATHTRGDWKESVSQRFANWLNAQLSENKNSLPFGEYEAKQWQTDLKKELYQLREEVKSYD